MAPPTPRTLPKVPPRPAADASQSAGAAAASAPRSPKATPAKAGARPRMWTRGWWQKNWVMATVSLLLVASTAGAGVWAYSGFTGDESVANAADSGSGGGDDGDDQSASSGGTGSGGGNQGGGGGGSSGGGSGANQAPELPSLISPSNAATSVNSGGTLLQFGAADPDGDVLSFQVKMSTQDPPTDAVCAWQSGTSCSSGDLSPDTTYYWQVTAKDLFGLTRSGPVWSFTTGSGTQPDENEPPNAPSAPSPASGETEVDYVNGPTLSWSGGDPDGGTVQYRVQFGDDPGALGELCAWQASTSCATGSLEHTTTYYWKVTAQDAAGESTQGPTWEFQTQTFGGEGSNKNPGSHGDECGLLGCRKDIEIQ